MRFRSCRSPVVTRRSDETDIDRVFALVPCLFSSLWRTSGTPQSGLHSPPHPSLALLQASWGRETPSRAEIAAIFRRYTMPGTDRRYRCHPFESQIIIAVCDEVVPPARPAAWDGGMICVLHIWGQRGRELFGGCSTSAAVDRFQRW
jgi:hypothetical protein